MMLRGGESGGGDVTGKASLVAVAAAIACCGIPLLIATGLTASAGVALRNLALIGGAAVLLIWLVVRAVRQTRHHRAPETHSAIDDAGDPHN